MARLRLPISCLVMLIGLAVFSLGLYYLDPILLVHHNVGEGWISNIYTDPHQLPGGRSQNSYYADIYYAYTDTQGELYRRSAPGMGTVGEIGDKFTVLYLPESPSRHLPLTLWGLLKAFCSLAFGIACGVYGFRQCRIELAQNGNQWTLQGLLQQLRRRETDPPNALYPSINKAAEKVLRKMRYESSLPIYGWLVLPSPSNPRQHSLYYVFATDETLLNATQKGVTDRIHTHTHAMLKQLGYPDKLLGNLNVLFSSIETIKQDFGVATLTRIRK